MTSAAATSVPDESAPESAVSDFSDRCLRSNHGRFRTLATGNRCVPRCPSPAQRRDTMSAGIGTAHGDGMSTARSLLDDADFVAALDDSDVAAARDTWPAGQPHWIYDAPPPPPPAP